ncbi:hybrid sensor histidine kinase/response regulator [Seohaeicola zhoushanensis]|uniref:histidine kinase n=2 Tax=Seohaeicola zhoushanensis TaxID=1569283 RepID=A0A8J3MAU9_9RHOB|nr:hybrid sensor histidine kinase/response regulator [Seohaeicola zhoushanensis]
MSLRPDRPLDISQPVPPSARVLVLVLMAGSILGVTLLLRPPDPLPNAGMVLGLTFALVAAAVALRQAAMRYGRRKTADLLDNIIGRDARPSLVADGEGAILWRNAAAERRFSDSGCDSLTGTLRGLFANPASMIYRLQARARREGALREEVIHRIGHLRISVQALAGGFLWRIEDFADPDNANRNAETLPVPMLTLDRSGRVHLTNEAARRLAGGPINSLEALFDSLPVMPGAINRIRTADGLKEVIVSEGETGPGRRVLCLLPILREAAPDHASVFETIPVPMLKIAPSGRILAANTLAMALIGAEIGPETKMEAVMEGLGRPIADWLEATIAGGQANNSEFLRLSRTDKEIFVQVTLSRVTERGETRLIAVLSDATELKTLEAQFVQSQKMQAIGQLAGGVAHDFNNLLTAISGHCDLLLLRHDQGDPDYGDLVQVNQNANRAAALVSQLLAFSRKQTLRPEVIDLRDTLADLTHLLNRLVGERVTLTLRHDPVLSPIRADKRQLEQVLMNLVVNARDAMPEGGEIRIETEIATLAHPLQRDRATVPPGEYVCVRVIDGGTGIAPDKLSKVFEPFYTTKRTGEGTGLGLSTAYGIVKQTGGYIFVDSVLGEGASFTMYFPAHRCEVQPVPTAAPPKRPAQPKHGVGVVLLVEDEAPVRAFASRALRLRGYTVLEAESAEEALRTLEDPELAVDIFVTDVVMPGMDGPSWVREALKARPNVRVVFVSGYAEGAFDGGLVSVPNSVFLSKPFSLNQLTETVHQQLH